MIEYVGMSKPKTYVRLRWLIAGTKLNKLLPYNPI